MRARHRCARPAPCPRFCNHVTSVAWSCPSRLPCVTRTHRLVSIPSPSPSRSFQALRAARQPQRRLRDRACASHFAPGYLHANRPRVFQTATWRVRGKAERLHPHHPSHARWLHPRVTHWQRGRRLACGSSRRCRRTTVNDCCEARTHRLALQVNRASNKSYLPPTTRPPEFTARQA